MGNARQIIWLSEFVNRLTFNETFWQGCKNDTKKMNETSTIVVPGQDVVEDSFFITNNTITDVDGNAISYPAAVEVATFDDFQYNVIKRGFKPFDVMEEDTKELTVNGQSETLTNKTNKLKEDLAAVIGHGFTTAETGNILRTTGGARANEFGNSAAKAITMADIRAGDLFLNRQHVPKMGRRLLVTATGFNDLLGLTEINGVNVFQPTYDSLIEGKVGRLLGYDVYMVFSLASFTAALGKKPLQGATELATDLECAVMFHPSMMRYALSAGNLKVTRPTGRYTEADTVEGWARVAATPNSFVRSNTIVGAVTLVEGV